MAKTEVEKTRERLLEKAERYRRQMMERDGNVVHGGESAVRQLSLGGEFSGPLLEVAHEVENELALYGQIEIVRRQAIRITAVADIYFGLCVVASERNDLEALDRYVKRFGWLATSSLRAWRQLKEDEEVAGQVLDYEKFLEEERAGQDGHTLD